MKNVFCIIDIQPAFMNDFPFINKIINKAKEFDPKDTLFICAEYLTNGSTNKHLYKFLKNYGKVTKTIVYDSDKSPGIIRRLKKLKCDKKVKNFYYCGVYTDACVSATVEGMTGALPNHKHIVLSDVCYTWGDDAQKNGLEHMKFIGATVV